ncbi:TPA: hypothetical protein ACKRTJ_003434 [Proteus mirabilis]|uniref:hypothetical protein n=1 Tax=Proteus TaxID=583 RepID=UPI000536F292|nr:MULTISPECIES: hypothetical protein [Proteus]AUU40624.1 hypothetical protein MC73_017195 [Proteus mirabilis]EKT9734394.1 hypothetical protein [Proteus mirabilis]EKV1609220.1 hypothetical protein [Proteus mirabilis]EKV7295883.1 hypothetical protein [Proteus mirabilis]EKV7660892.1 hypothetical protein [Proteus mirabilis]
MSSLNRSIASVLGTLATLYLAYQAQARCEVNMSHNDTPTSVQRAVRLIMSFITVVIIGGLSDAIIKATFSSL